MNVVVYTDLSGKEPHRQVGNDMIVTSGNLDGVMVSTLPWDAKDVGSIHVLGIPNVHPPPTPTVLELRVVHSISSSLLPRRLLVEC